MAEEKKQEQSREKEKSEPEQEAKEQERSWQIGKGTEIRTPRI